MTQELVIGARRSPLARIQAFAVGQALLRQDSRLRLRYVFAESRGDRSSEPSAALVTARGGFTEDLGQALDAGLIDVAVHSWKDLPLRERVLTRVAASLPRADSRDLLLIRRSATDRLADTELRVLSSSSRRRLNLEAFLGWALPRAPRRVAFAPVRGDIGTRLAKLLRGDGDALVIAKAAIDRLLASGDEEFRATRAQVRAALAQCRVIVLPLTLNPAAPGQGALALEVRRDASDVASRLAGVNDAVTKELVERERALALEFGGDDSPLGITRQRYAYGDIEFVRGERHGRPFEHVKLLRHAAPLPRARRQADIWTGGHAGAELFNRVPVADATSRWTRHTGLLVARCEALPPGSTVSDDTIVWTAGLATWRKLAARGVWVTGSDESLGETGAVAIRHLYPEVTRWIKLSHESGFDTAFAERVATYRLERRRLPEAVHGHTHFFWRSGSQFMEYLRAFPGLALAWHGSGPGNTLRILQHALDSDRVQPFLSARQFSAELSS